VLKDVSKVKKGAKKMFFGEAITIDKILQPGESHEVSINFKVDKDTT